MLRQMFRDDSYYLARECRILTYAAGNRRLAGCKAGRTREEPPFCPATTSLLPDQIAIYTYLHTKYFSISECPVARVTHSITYIPISLFSLVLFNPATKTVQEAGLWVIYMPCYDWASDCIGSQLPVIVNYLFTVSGFLLFRGLRSCPAHAKAEREVALAHYMAVSMELLAVFRLVV